MDDGRVKAFTAAAAVFALDRLTKYVVERSVSLADSYGIIPGFFAIVRSQNRGVAFGIFNDSTSEWRTWFLIALSIAAVIGVIVALCRIRHLDRTATWAFALILGGAAGNLFDRIAWGQVTDFLLFYIGQYQWPAFNVADSAIVIGCGLLLIDQLRPKRQVANVP